MISVPGKVIASRISQAIREKVFPGCVVGWVRKGKPPRVLAFGSFTYEENSPPVRGDTIFDVASITKSIPTSSLALKLIGEGKLNLQDRLIDFVPEVSHPDRDAITIRHLLNQTLDYAERLSLYKDLSADDIISVIYKMGLRTKPGSKYAYSNVTSILLGRVVERIYKESLSQLAEKYFFAPLGMRRTTFHPQKFNRNEIVPTEMDEWRGRAVQGEVHDESAYKLGMKNAVGSAGLFSTAADLLIFMKMLLNKGNLDGKEYFPQSIIELIYKDSTVEGDSIGLGWELNKKQTMGKYASSTTIGKTGFTGCSCVCDIRRDIAFVILSNRTYPKRSDPEYINQVRRDIADIIFEDLT